MNKLVLCLSVLTSVLFFSSAFAQTPDNQNSGESITITTYYPSPYGSYAQLRANNMAIGSSYNNAAVAPPPDGLLVQGQVGLGTTSPVSQMHLVSTGASGPRPQIRVETVSATNKIKALQFFEDGDQVGFISVSGSTTSPNPNILTIGSDGRTGLIKTRPTGIRFSLLDSGSGNSATPVSPGEVMTIITGGGSGYVGIGTTTPQAKLHLYDRNNDSVYIDLDRSNSPNADGGIRFRTTRANGDGTSVLQWAWLTEGNYGGWDSGANLDLKAYDDDGTLLGSRLYIERGRGNVGIGNTAPAYPAPNNLNGNLDVNDIYLRGGPNGDRWVSKGPELAQAYRSDNCKGCPGGNNGGAWPITVLYGPSDAFIPKDNVNADPSSSWYKAKNTPDRLDGLGCNTGWRMVGCWASNRGNEDLDLVPYNNSCVTNDFDQLDRHSDISIICMKQSN